MMSRDKCETCIFWGAERADDHDQPYGSCRIKPPVIVQYRSLTIMRGDNPYKGQWPWTAFDDWCGGHVLADQRGPWG